MKSTIIKLPVLKNADDSVFIDATYKYSNKGYVPDWGFMESYIRSLNYKPLTTENKQSSTQFLNDNWKDFTVKELFKVVGSKTTKKEDLEEIGEGIYPYITTSASNNGVDGHYDFWTEEGNVITVESACMGFSTYQEEKFSASDHVEILKPYFNLNKYIAIFIITIINNENFKYSYGRKCNQTKINNMVLRLPVTESDEPDWAYMEDYIKSLPYGDRV